MTLNVSMAREELGRYIQHKGVVGHEILFEDPVLGIASSSSPLALPSGRVFGERQWEEIDEKVAATDDDSEKFDRNGFRRHSDAPKV